MQDIAGFAESWPHRTILKLLWLFFSSFSAPQYTWLPCKTISNTSSNLFANDQVLGFSRGPLGDYSESWIARVFFFWYWASIFPRLSFIPVVLWSKPLPSALSFFFSGYQCISGTYLPHEFSFHELEPQRSRNIKEIQWQIKTPPPGRHKHKWDVSSKSQ